MLLECESYITAQCTPAWYVHMKHTHTDKSEHITPKTHRGMWAIWHPGRPRRRQWPQAAGIIAWTRSTAGGSARKSRKPPLAATRKHLEKQWQHTHTHMHARTDKVKGQFMKQKIWHVADDMRRTEAICDCLSYMTELARERESKGVSTEREKVAHSESMSDVDEIITFKVSLTEKDEKGKLKTSVK